MDVNQYNTRSIYLYCHPTFNAFFVLDNNTNQWEVSSYENVYDKKNIDTEELKVWLSRNMAIFNLQYEKIIIAIDAESFILVPTSFNEEQKSTAWQKFQNKANKDEVVLSQVIDNESVVYSISKNIYDILDNHFENKEFIFGDFGLIQFSRKNEEKVVAQIYGNAISIAFHDNEKLRYYNRFKCQDVNDFLYYILLAFKTLELDPHINQLYIGGLIEQEAPLYKEIWGFIENISIIEKHDYVKKEIPFHYFFNILNLPA